jgi:hypothetical protein
LLPNCSQSTVEVSVLGLDRSGDVSGALAPDIWFSFLRSGENEELLSVCDHNLKDISGLASLFLCLGEIAAAPMESRFKFDTEALALRWTKARKKNPVFFSDEKHTGELLLRIADSPKAAFVLALDCFGKGRNAEGRKLMQKIAYDASVDPKSLRIAALKSLAIDAERRLGDISLALDYTSAALAIPGISRGRKKELEERRKRLESKRPT